jgi:hypothetical protein
MKTVISASRRTDIPAFYLKWFMEKIQQGSVTVQNPFYRDHYYHANLKPDAVDWIVFWSRNYAKLLKHYQFFASYKLFFHFTIISHHPYLEKYALEIRQALAQTERLVSLYGAERVIWRYDPIVIWQEQDAYVANYNEKQFNQLCREFGQLGINKCYFSIVSPYVKFIRRFNGKYPQLNLISHVSAKQEHVVSRMKAVSSNYGIRLYSCCNDTLVDGEILKGSCISGSLLNKFSGVKKVSEARVPTRKDCGCTRAIDIGNYRQQPCHFGCIYCYANPVGW